MRVKVQLYARLRELAGAAEWTGDVPAGATIADVWRAVAADHPALAPFERNVSCARNEEFAKRSTAVADGDDVAFLPPVSGGA